VTRARNRIAAAACAAVCLAVSVIAQDAAQPPAPTLGEVVLLANGSGPEVTTALAAALRSSDPGVRTVAGRIVSAVPHGALRRDVIGALARERDPGAGAEFVRDLLHLTGAADLALVEAQAGRLGGPAILALAEWFARMQPAQFAAKLPQWASRSDLPAPSWSGLVATSVLQHPETSDAVLRAWMGVAPTGGWDRVISAFRWDFDEEDARLFADALNSPRSGVREETVWFVLKLMSDKSSVPKTMTEAAGRQRQDASPWEALGRELIARGRKPPASGDRRDVIAAEGAGHIIDVARIREAPQLTALERDAVRALIPATQDPLAAWGKSFAESRTIPPVTPGVIGATFTAAKCRPGSVRAMGATVSYAPDGAPLHVVLGSSGLSPECTAAWTALARTIVADADEPIQKDVTQAVFLPLSESFLACGDERAGPSGPAASTAQPAAQPARVITQPRKLKDAPPEYPQEAQRRGIQGVVIVETIISPRGCVSSARVIRSLPFLDSAALTAVAGWQFTPTLLDGVAVPVVMTVTVNFRM